jgi:cytochrome c oxidase subunit 1
VLALVGSVPLVVAVLALLSTRIHRRGIAGTPVPFAVGGLVLVLLGVVAVAVLAIRHDDLAGTTFATARVDALWCGGVLALVGALVYWWPKLFGRLLDPRLAGLSFAIAFGSALLLVLGHAVAGEQGQAARSGAVVDDAGTASLVASIGSWGLVLGLAVLALAALRSASGRRAGDDPWHADTLEWFTTSPPPPGNFDSLPPITSERPLADLRQALKEKGAL